MDSVSNQIEKELLTPEEKFSLTIKSIKKSYGQLLDSKELTQEEVNRVLKPLQHSDIKIAEMFDVHFTTVRKWRGGTNKPNGRNKLAFFFILNTLEE